jgi:hypothetical protein
VAGAKRKPVDLSAQAVLSTLPNELQQEENERTQNE